MPSAYLQWRFHSGKRVVARGPLVVLLLCFNDKVEDPAPHQIHTVVVILSYIGIKGDVSIE